jgi:hypothetical protein
VSTARQRRSGLGLEAQRQAVAVYFNGGNWKIVAEFTEVESGKRSEWPSSTGRWPQRVCTAVRWW